MGQLARTRLVSSAPAGRRAGSWGSAGEEANTGPFALWVRAKPSVARVDATAPPDTAGSGVVPWERARPPGVVGLCDRRSRSFSLAPASAPHAHPSGWPASK